MYIASAITLYQFYMSVINKIAFFLTVTVGPPAQQACKILNRAEFANLKVITWEEDLTLFFVQ